MRVNIVEERPLVAIEPISKAPPPLVTVAPSEKTNGVAHCLTMTAAVKTLSHDVFAQFWTQKATKGELNIPWIGFINI